MYPRGTRVRGALMGTTALTVTGILGGFFANPAFAQQDAAAPDETDSVEEMVVTGSRLATGNLSSPVPVFQLGSDEVDARGSTRIEDILNILPQIRASQTTVSDNIDVDGVSTVDLRGLGAIRTLALVNGKRLPFGSPESAAANVDMVPAQLIERVDLVTGGASAVYGADAVAGVVNFILKEDFEGFIFDGQAGFRQADNDIDFMEQVAAASGLETPDSVTDGRGVFATMLMGANTADDRGNVTMFLGFEDLNPIRSGDRDNGTCILSEGDSEFSVQGLECAGSSNFRRFLTNNDPFSPIESLFQTADGTLVPFGSVPQTVSTFNFEPSFRLQTKRERFNFNASGHYNIWRDVDVYGNLSFMNTETETAVSPTATFNQPFQVNCDNPLLDDAPQGEVGNLFDVYNCAEVIAAVEAGMPNPVTGVMGSLDIPFINSFRLADEPGVAGIPLVTADGEETRRVNRITITTWRAVAGFRGTLLDNFDWDVYGSFARVLQDRELSGALDFDRVQEALFLVEDANGNVVCRDPAADGCVPFNIFSRNADGTTLITPESLSFVTGTVGRIDGETEQVAVAGSITGNLGQYGISSPFADSGVSVALGAEYRRDSLSLSPDRVSSVPAGPGGIIGLGGFDAVSGQIRVVEGFIEAQVPVVEGLPYMDELVVSGAYRRSEYETEGEIAGETALNTFGTNTWFLGAVWAVDEQLRIRGQFQRAIRAPNVIELFSPVSNGGFEFAPGDPCAGENPQATLEQCALTGVTPEQFGTIPVQPSREFNSIVGGNPDLQPEVADTITLGLQITPSIAPGLSISIDYFDIQIEDQIGTVPPQQAISQCFATGSAEFCDLINRDNFGSIFVETGLEFGVAATNVNIATLTTSGFDFQIGYDLDLAEVGLPKAGALNFNFAGTWTREFEQVQFPGTEPLDCLDKFGDQCGTPRPAFRHRLLATWDSPWNLRTTATWRYVGNVEPVVEVSSPINEMLESRNYLDLSVQARVTDYLTLRAGVNNLLGNAPPITSVEGGNEQAANTFPGVYDLSRFVFFGVNVQL